MKKRKPGLKRPSVRLVVEHLEARHLLTGYVLTDLENFGGDTRAQAINSSGQIAGWSDDHSLIDHAVFWDSTHTIHDLDSFAEAYGINDSGQVVGIRQDDSYPFNSAVIWDTRTGESQDLGNLQGDPNGSSRAYGINSQGQVAGESSLLIENQDYYHAFFWDPNTKQMQDLGILAGYADSISSANAGINDAGEVAGTVENGHGDWHAFLWTSKTGMVDLLPGISMSIAYAMNSFGQVTGTSSNGSFLWTPVVPNGTTGTVTYLNDCTGGDRAGAAYAINDNDQVVGTAGVDGAFVWDSTNCASYLILLR